MNFYELEIANALKQEIEDVSAVVNTLKRSIENHESNSKLRGYKRIFRLVNCKLSVEEETKARIFLFDGLSCHGTEIPVDQEICEKVLEIFETKLEEKKKEFTAIGRS